MSQSLSQSLSQPLFHPLSQPLFQLSSDDVGSSSSKTSSSLSFGTYLPSHFESITTSSNEQSRESIKSSFWEVDEIQSTDAK